VPYLSASAVVFHYEEALYQVYAPLPLLKNYESNLTKFYKKQSNPADVCGHRTALVTQLLLCVCVAGLQ